RGSLVPSDGRRGRRAREETGADTPFVVLSSDGRRGTVRTTRDEQSVAMLRPRLQPLHLLSVSGSIASIVVGAEKGQEHEDRCHRWDRAHRIAGSQDPERERARGGATFAVHWPGPAQRARPARGVEGGRRRRQPDKLANLR